ncbi:MAG: NADH-quinone oxidoreductase subunit J [Desulfobacterales bacterium]
MQVIFYLAAAVAVAATLMMITRANAVHALLYLIVSLLAVAVVFYLLGAPFIAILEIIIYAGAIMVLFIFVVMKLNLGDRSAAAEKEWLRPGTWTGPAILAAVLLSEVVYVVGVSGAGPGAPGAVAPRQVGEMLFGPYLIGVELSSMLLMAGLVGAFHLGRRRLSPNTMEHPSD